jgi:hypothetical protein
MHELCELLLPLVRQLLFRVTGGYTNEMAFLGREEVTLDFLMNGFLSTILIVTISLALGQSSFAVSNRPRNFS